MQCLQALEMGSGNRPTGQTDFITSNHHYFAALAGFFIIEDSLMKSGIELYSRAEVDALWETACSKIKAIMHEQFGLIQTSVTHGSGSPAAGSDACMKFVQVKYTLILLAKTLAGYGFFVQPLFEFLAGMRDKFEAILLSRLRSEIKEVRTAYGVGWFCFTACKTRRLSRRLC